MYHPLFHTFPISCDFTNENYIGSNIQVTTPDSNIRQHNIVFAIFYDKNTI